MFQKVFTIIYCSFLLFLNLPAQEKKEGVSVLLPNNPSKEEICRLSVQVRPSYRQLDYQEREMLGFIHIGMNTFTGAEWGTGSEDTSLFNPKMLNAEEWVKVFKDAGITGVILVAKHHDGFCLWPTKYSNHSIEYSPWKSGKGDLVGEVAEACKKYDMKFCLYLSPWDMHEATYGTEAYNDYYIHTLEELLTNYGPIYLLWFDGAGLDGNHNKKMNFDWNRIFKRIRELQPDVILSGNAPDVRWVGNEKGKGRFTEWCVQGINEIQPYWGKMDGYKATLKNLGSLDDLKDKKRLVWYPSRGGLPLRKGWFYNKNDDNSVKSLSYLIDSYFSTVGQNSNLLPNLSPDTTGRIPEKDAKRLIDFGNIIKKMKSVDFAKTAKIHYSKEWLFDGGIHTADGVNEATIEIELKKESRINVVGLKEDVENFGQRVDSFAVDALKNGKWEIIAQGSTVGYRRLIRLKEPIEVKYLRVRYLSSRISLSFKDFSLYYLQEIIKEQEEAKAKVIKVGITQLNTNNITYSSLEGMQNNNQTKYWGGRVVSFPASITFHFGINDKVRNLVYLPSSQDNANHFSKYNIWSSTDGKNWKRLVDRKIFGNIENNPVEQTIPLNINSDVRYIKFELLSLTSDEKQFKLCGLYLTE